MIPGRCQALTFTLAGWLAAGTTIISSSGGRPVDISERAHCAERVVVAVAMTVTPTWRTNSFGDRLIVSQVLLMVQETMKGATAGTLPMDLTGGTLNVVTLKVSSLPDLKPGERAIFFLDHEGSSNVPYLKGLGILKLDQNNRVVDSSLQLADIRRMVQNAK